jgi:enoyl-CoA hydratase/carnithine racemase
VPRKIIETAEGEACLGIEPGAGFTLFRLLSADGTNRITFARVRAMTRALSELASVQHPQPLIVAGNDRFFSAGADLNEIADLHGAAAFDFARGGQELMRAIERFPAPVIAGISGYCMGGGLDLALACRLRVCAPNAIFGHRGAALGIITGWGGTQRLPRLLGKPRALQIFLTAEKLHAEEALGCGLVQRISEDPISAAAELLTHF